MAGPSALMRTGRASFSEALSWVVVYSKPFLSITDQLALMKSRGVVVTDEPRASACIERVGYYRLSGYSYPFRHFAQVVDVTGKMVDTVSNDFLPYTNFNTIMDLYVFDKKLRLLMLDAIERVEVGLRVGIGHMLGRRDPLAHLNSDQLHGNFTKKMNTRGKTAHAEWMARYNECVRRSSEEFVAHFQRKYPQSQLPIWIAIELWDFGLTSRFLEGMKHNDRLELARSFGIPREDLLLSWIRAINNIRNVCAHHGRLWNTPVVDYPKATKFGEIPQFDHMVGKVNEQTRLYYVAGILRYLLLKINPTTTWSNRLKEHLATFPHLHPISIQQMGFPANWGREQLWR